MAGLIENSNCKSLYYNNSTGIKLSKEQTVTIKNMQCIIKDSDEARCWKIDKVEKNENEVSPVHLYILVHLCMICVMYLYQYQIVLVSLI